MHMFSVRSAVGVHIVAAATKSPCTHYRGGSRACIREDGRESSFTISTDGEGESPHFPGIVIFNFRIDGSRGTAWAHADLNRL